MTTDSHREVQVVWGKRLGCRPQRDDLPYVKFSEIWTGTIPEHPGTVRYLDDFTTWQMLGNDRFGDCGPVSVANYRALITQVLTGFLKYPTQTDVFDLYRRSGNPDFNPDTGEGDNGVVLQEMLGEVHKNGIGGDKAVAFAKVDVTNEEEVRAAIAIFGGLIVGVNLEQAQQNQETVWDYVPGSGEWGGHAIYSGGYDPDPDSISWATVVKMTQLFFQHQVQEAWVVIWPEHFGTKQFMTGIDIAALAVAYHSVTGDILPVPAPPSPGPTPAPTPEPGPDNHLSREILNLYHWLGGWLKRHGIL